MQFSRVYVKCQAKMSKKPHRTHPKPSSTSLIMNYSRQVSAIFLILNSSASPLYPLITGSILCCGSKNNTPHLLWMARRIICFHGKEMAQLTRPDPGPGPVLPSDPQAQRHTVCHVNRVTLLLLGCLLSFSVVVATLGERLLACLYAYE